MYILNVFIYRIITLGDLYFVYPSLFVQHIWLNVKDKAGQLLITN